MKKMVLDQRYFLHVPRSAAVALEHSEKFPVRLSARLLQMPIVAWSDPAPPSYLLTILAPVFKTKMGYGSCGS